MNKFYYITRNKKDNPTTVKLFREACLVRDVECLAIHSENYNFSHSMPLEKRSMLYRISTDSQSNTLFKTMAAANVATIFNDLNAALAIRDNSALLHGKHNLQIIKTVFDLTRDRDLLAAYTEYLGGFPVIIKALGGSHGVGVIKVESFESLVSIADYLIGRQQGTTQYLLRQFIDHEFSARLTVLDGKVIDSIQYQRVSGDFRSNVGSGLQVEAKKFDAVVEALAVQGVQVLQASFGGADILIDKSGAPFLAEVNIPCFFPRSQNISGVDIAGKIVDSLIDKSKCLV